jgi:hypothetical protein
MKLPRWLKTLIVVITVAGVAGFVLSVCCQNSKFPKAIADLALVLTLIAVIIYVYYTYVLAKEAWTPSASISFQRTEQDPLHFLVFITNSSKVSLHCWCNLNAKVNGQAVSLGGFYWGQSSFDVQPYSIVQGHFSVRDILARANRTVEQMIQNAQPGDKSLLYLDVSFWYCPFGSRDEIHNPKQPHYFDFERQILIADF